MEDGCETLTRIYESVQINKKKEEDKSGNPIWAETHWLDEQDVLNSLRLHEVADDVIAEGKRKDSYKPAKEAA